MNTTNTTEYDKYVVGGSVKLLAVLETLSSSAHWLTIQDVSDKTKVDGKALTYNEARGALYSGMVAGWVELKSEGESFWRLAPYVLGVVMNVFEARRQALAEENDRARLFLSTCAKLGG